jgi:hypothetical protein
LQTVVGNPGVLDRPVQRQGTGSSPTARRGRPSRW